jgi:hypothetical protein
MSSLLKHKFALHGVDPPISVNPHPPVGDALSFADDLADAAAMLRVDPIALLYVATVLAQRLDSANRGLLELKRQVQAGEPRSVIGQTVEKIEELLGATDANSYVCRLSL